MSREAMQMALDMLNEIADDVYCDQKLEGVISVLRQALVDADDTSQERVDETVKRRHEWFDCTDDQLIEEVRRRGFVIRDAQIEVPKREWVGLTDEEIQDMGHLSEKFDASNSEWFDRWEFARALEAKLREKNKC